MKSALSTLKWCLVGTLFLAYSCKKDSDYHTPIGETLKGAVGKEAVSQTVTTIAGDFNKPEGLINGPLSCAMFSSKLMEVVEAADGSLYLNDQGNSVIRKVSTDGTVSTFAGVAGVSGNRNGEKGQAQFNQLTGLDINLKGDLYFLTKNLNNNGWQVKTLTTNGEVKVVTDLDSTFIDQLAVTSTDVFLSTKDQIYKYSLSEKCITKYGGFFHIGGVDNLTISKNEERYLSYSFIGYVPWSTEYIYDLRNRQYIIVQPPIRIILAHDIFYRSDEGAEGVMYYALRHHLVVVNIADKSIGGLAGTGSVDEDRPGPQVPSTDGPASKSEVQPKFLYVSNYKPVIYFTENNQQGRSGLLRIYTF